MYKLILVLLLFVSVSVSFGQITSNYGVLYLFKGTDWEDNLTTEYNKWTDEHGDKHNYSYVSSDTLADTLTTRILQNQTGTHNVSLNVITDSTVTGAPDTMDYVLEMGVYCGEGHPDSTGYLWKHLLTGAQDTSLRISLRDSTWWTDFNISQYKLRIRETTANKNKYILWDRPYKSKR